ncbi:hypothetical protein, partial [Streptococcus australis]|uniref:hypothetical protein n=1 Tax=Streptococcus australis TaxID=113107 RepID=UPI001CBC1C48
MDEIGEKIQKQVYNAALNHINDLKGYLNNVKFSNGERASSNDPCEFKYDELLGTNSNRYPCTNLSRKDVERFSNTLGGQCTKEKMRRDGIGACAPYRRLHLCHHNLETIKNTTSMTTHDLLLEVCMAAKYEGNSIERYYPPYQLTNEVTSSQLCTVLARSFADIGDIVRGKDLYSGNKKKNEKDREKEKLQTNLKNIFEKLKSSN